MKIENESVLAVLTANILIFLFFPFDVRAQERGIVQPSRICPDNLNSQHDIGRYNFGFQSWGWLKNNDHFACSCIRNLHTSRAMYVRWDGAGIENFLGPKGTSKDTSFTMRNLPSPARPGKLMSLWYGAQPERIDVLTVTGQKKLQNFSLRTKNYENFSATPTVILYDNEEKKSDKQVSYNIAHIPDLRHSSHKSFLSHSELVSYVEEHPEILRTLTMKFSSEIINLEDNNSEKRSAVANSCQYALEPSARIFDNQLNVESTPFYIKFLDDNLHKRMTGQVVPVGLGGARWDNRWGDTRQNSALTLSSREPVLNMNAAIEKKDSQLLIMAPDLKTIVARMPVIYYENREQ